MPAKSDQTRQNILDAAYELFLSQGYSATSMRQIASQAGLALGGIYNHFASKDEIFQEVIIAQHPYLKIMPLIHSAPGENAEEFLRNAARIIQAELGTRPDFMKLMMIEIVEFNGSHFQKMFETISPHIFPLLMRIGQPGNCLRDLPMPLILRSLMGTIAAFYITESLMQSPALPAEMRNVTLEDFMDIYMHGILVKDEG
ncbi:MAG: TetR/AcrR family transcriptional regulator [Anaerolineales bacterium]